MATGSNYKKIVIQLIIACNEGERHLAFYVLYGSERNRGGGIECVCNFVQNKRAGEELMGEVDLLFKKVVRGGNNFTLYIHSNFFS